MYPFVTIPQLFLRKLCHLYHQTTKYSSQLVLDLLAKKKPYAQNHYNLYRLFFLNLS